MNYEFPQFRRIQNRSYYKILSETEIIEIQIVGNRILKYYLKAELYFEKSFIKDLLSTDSGRYEISNRSEFDELEKSGN